MIKNKFLNCSFAFSIFFSLAVFTESALSFDLKTWNGSVCNPMFQDVSDSIVDGPATPPTLLGQRILRSKAGILNLSAQESLLINCSITTDRYTENYDGTQGAFVYVSAPAESSTFCNLSERKGKTGGEVMSTSGKISGTGSIWLDTEISEPGGNRVLVCLLPPGGTLHQITILEFNNTDNAHNL